MGARSLAPLQSNPPEHYVITWLRLSLKSNLVAGQLSPQHLNPTSLVQQQVPGYLQLAPVQYHISGEEKP